MIKTVKYSYDFNMLSEEAAEFLRSLGMCIDDRDNHLWGSKNAFLEQLIEAHENGSPKLDGEVDPESDELPEWFWTKLGLPLDIRQEIEGLWVDGPDNEVEWE